MIFLVCLLALFVSGCLEKSEKKDVSDRLQIELASNSTLWTSSDMPLEMVLADPVHRKMFRMLAESKMCLESVLLWERCNDFKKLVAKEPAVGPPLAFNIYSNFLAPSATKQVLVCVFLDIFSLLLIFAGA